MTTPEVVGADNEEAIGIDGFVGANATVPPTRFRVVWVIAPRGVMMTREGMAYQYGVRSIVVQRSVSLKNQLKAGKRVATAQRKVFTDTEGLGRYMIHWVV